MLQVCRRSWKCRPTTPILLTAAARLSSEARTQAEGVGEQLTLDQYAILAEFKDAPDAVERLLGVARWGSMDHEAERIRRHRAEQAEPQPLPPNGSQRATWRW